MEKSVQPLQDRIGYQREWRRRNKDKIKLYNLDWKQRHPERYQAILARNRIGDGTVTRICVVCKKEFLVRLSHNKQAKFCSRSCYLKTWREKNKDKIKKYSLQYRMNHPDKYKENIKKSNKTRRDSGYQSNWYLNRKLRVFKMLGGPRCVYCSCDDLRALEVNHKNGEGRKDAKRGMNLYNSILRGERPVDDLEVACKVCNSRHYLVRKYGVKMNNWDIRWKS